MEYHVSSSPLKDIAADWLIVGVPQADSFSGAASELDGMLGGQLTRLRASEDLTGKLAETLVLPDVPPLAATRVLLVGLGSSSDANHSTLSRAFTTAALAISKRPEMSVACLLPEFADVSLHATAVAREVAAALTVGCVGPGIYQAEPKRHPFQSITCVPSDGTDNGPIKAAVEAGAVVGESINLVRDLVNRHASDVYPETFARQAVQVASDAGVRCEIFEEARLKQEKMGSLLAVAAGSDRPPRMVLFEYRGAAADQPVTALVGKGVTFDSGGLSLKPSDSMKSMKGDMAGAATVLAVVTAAARLKLPVNIFGAIGLVENMISGSSYKLGDVLTARNGVTIEVHNTDAEGRLVLADVLSYVVEQKVDRMLDLATLTGSCVVALGEDITGAFTNDQSWCDEVMAAAQRAGEEMWQLPMHDFFSDEIKSEVADIKNVGKRWGGASIAAKFLERFVDDVPWVHLDIAGPSFADSPAPHRDSGGTGAMVRTLIELLASSGETPGR